MSETIRTYKDLCEERDRLKNLLAIQKQRVRDDWSGIKETFEPVSNVFETLGKMVNMEKGNPLINNGLKIVTDLLIKNFVLAKAGWITRLAVPFVVKNYSSHVIADKGRIVFNKLEKLFRKRKRSAARKTPDPSDVNLAGNDFADNDNLTGKDL